jgi:hypothetical protein
MWVVPFYKSIVNIINTHLHFCVSQLKPVKKILRREALFWCSCFGLTLFVFDWWVIPSTCHCKLFTVIIEDISKMMKAFFSFQNPILS